MYKGIGNRWKFIEEEGYFRRKNSLSKDGGRRVFDSFGEFSLVWLERSVVDRECWRGSEDFFKMIFVCVVK